MPIGSACVREAGAEDAREYRGRLRLSQRPVQPSTFLSSLEVCGARHVLSEATLFFLRSAAASSSKRASKASGKAKLYTFKKPTAASSSSSSWKAGRRRSDKTSKATFTLVAAKYQKGKLRAKMLENLQSGQLDDLSEIRLAEFVAATESKKV